MAVHLTKALRIETVSAEWFAERAPGKLWIRIEDCQYGTARGIGLWNCPGCRRVVGCWVGANSAFAVS